MHNIVSRIADVREGGVTPRLDEVDEEAGLSILDGTCLDASKRSTSIWVRSSNE